MLYTRETHVCTETPFLLYTRETHICTETPFLTLKHTHAHNAVKETRVLLLTIAELPCWLELEAGQSKVNKTGE